MSSIIYMNKEECQKNVDFILYNHLAAKKRNKKSTFELKDLVKELQNEYEIIINITELGLKINGLVKKGLVIEYFEKYVVTMGNNAFVNVV